MTLVTRCSFVAALFFLLAGSAVARQPESLPRITLNGRPAEVELHSPLGAAGTPAVGDLIEVDGWYLTLRSLEPVELACRQEDGGTVYRVHPDGRREVIMISLESEALDDGPVDLAPLSALKPEERAALWGIAIDGWAPGLAEELATLPPEVLLHVDLSRWNADEAIAGIPRTTSNIVLEAYVIEEEPDLNPLAAAKALVVHLPNLALNAAHFPTWTQLRSLELWAGALEGAGELRRQSELRSLRLRGCEGVEDIEFIAGMPKLEKLDISGLVVESLDAMGGHPALRVINADMSGVAELPAAKAPAMRELRVLGTEIPAEQVREFRELNPECKVVHEWAASLTGTLETADRLRVRSGGTCHRRPSEERTLCDVKGEEVASFIKLIAIDEEATGMHCQCCGDPTLEFYDGERLVATVGFHHGQLIRWPGGWPADAMLKPESAESMITWLAKQGVTGPKEEWEEGQAQRTAAERRFRIYESIVPEAVRKGLEAAESEEQVVEAFTYNLKPQEAALIYLKLAGCQEGPWDRTDQIESLILDTMLPLANAEDVLQVALEHKGDRATARGAARWLLAQEKWEGLPIDKVSELLPAIADAALTNSDRGTRLRTIHTLQKIGTEPARAALRRVMRGEIVVEPEPDEDSRPGGRVVLRSNGFDESVPESDAVIAAMALAELGDEASAVEAAKVLEAANQGAGRK